MDRSRITPSVFLPEPKVRLKLYKTVIHNSYSKVLKYTPELKGFQMISDWLIVKKNTFRHLRISSSLLRNCKPQQVISGEDRFKNPWYISWKLWHKQKNPTISRCRVFFRALKIYELLSYKTFQNFSPYWILKRNIQRKTQNINNFAQKIICSKKRRPYWLISIKWCLRIETIKF